MEKVFSVNVVDDAPESKDHFRMDHDHSNFYPLILLRFGSVDILKLPQCSVGNILP